MNMRLPLLTASCLFAIPGCSPSSKELEERALRHSHDVIAHIADSSVIDYFSPEHFPRVVIAENLRQLRLNCDLSRKEGGFVGKHHTDGTDGADSVTFFYEYRYNCANIRYVLQYALERDTFEFTNMLTENADTPNPLVGQGK